MSRHQSCLAESGFTLIEILVSLVILIVGLLGLAGLQARAQQAETESYQRVQALALLNDMADRINTNRVAAAADGYVTGIAGGDVMGTGSAKACSAPSTRADIDLCQWDAALKGAAESVGTCALSGTNCVGAMIGARGCVTKLAASQFLIQVAWQGLSSTAPPPTSVTCASGAYGSESLGLRRAVTTVVQIGTLTP